MAPHRFEETPFPQRVRKVVLEAPGHPYAIARRVPGFVFLEAPVGKDPDQRNYIVSNAKMEATGWRPKFSLDAGIEELVKGFTMIRNTRYGNV